MKNITMSSDLEEWLGIPLRNASFKQSCAPDHFFGFDPAFGFRTFDKISNILDICVNVMVLMFLLVLCFCSSDDRCIRRRKDLSKLNLQRKIPKKYGHHNIRNILVLVHCMTWCLNIGEVSLRRLDIETSFDLKFLMLAAPFTSLLSTFYSLVFYSYMELVGAHCIYLVFPQVLWGVQTITSSARIFEMICLLCATFSNVAPCIYSVSAFVSLCLLFLDTATIIEWFVIERHKQSVDLNPERRDRAPSNPVCKKPKGRKSNSLFLKSRRRLPPSDSAAENVTDMNPGGVDSTLSFGVYEQQNEEEEEEMNKLRYDHNESGFLSQCTFSWFVKVLRRGWERPLEFSDLDRIPDEESSKIQFEKFQAEFQLSKSRNFGLWRTFFNTFGRSLTVAGIFKLLGDCANVVGPLVIAPIVVFVKKVQEETEVVQDQEGKIHMVGWRDFMSNGWVLAFVALWASLLQSTFSQNSSHLLATLSIRLKCALQATIYHKILNVSTSRPHNKSSSNIDKDGSMQSGLQHSMDMGHVSNLFWEDVDNIMNFFMSCHYLWAIPLKLLGLVGLLYLQMGVSAVAASFIAVLVLLPIQLILAKAFVTTSKKISDSGDRRSSIINEVLLFIRTIKMLALNTLFLQKVKKVREEELKHLLRESLLRALMAFLMQASSILIILLAFVFFALFEEEPPDEGIIFSSLALFSQFTVPLFLLPNIVAKTIKAKRSVLRLQEFFALPEVPCDRLNIFEKEYAVEKQTCISSSRKPGQAVVKMDNATFSYGKNPADAVLRNLSFTIPKGKLTVVIGGVGSGKSSLLLSLLGELNLLAGKIHWDCNESVAYVSQTPWLLNCSLKKNILMGKGFLSRRYRKVLDVCSLVPDINLLPDGDGTEIGARGLNLSGGQRKRVTLARALYSDLSVVMMDCPFSALDATVAHQVFQKVRDLLLRKGSASTLILATQHHQLCAFADHILYLEDETICLQGSPEEVARQRPDLWSQWTSSSSTDSPDGGVEFGLKEERKSLQRRMTRKNMSRRHLLSDDKTLDRISCPSTKRHTDWSRFSPLQLLLPSEEMDFFPVPVTARRSQPPKVPIFRTLSSSPSFGRLDESKKSPFDRRLALSLPSRPSETKPRLRENPDGRRKSKRENSVFRKLFTSPSVRSRHPQVRVKKDRWNSRIWSFLSQKGSPLKEEGEQSEGESEKESETSDSDVCETLIDDEERERGTISKWNYVSYLEACGVILGVIYIVSLIINQAALISLDVWLGYWSKMCRGGNCSIPDEGVMCSSKASFDSLGNEDTLLTPNPKRETFPCSANMGGQHLLVFGLLSVLAAFTGLFTVCLAQVAAHRGRRKLFEHLVKALVAARVKFFDVTPIGRILTRFNTDILLIDKELGWSMMQFMYFALLCGSTLVVNGIVSPLFLIFSIPLVFLYYILQHIFRTTSIELKRLETLSRSPVVSLITETGDSPAVLRAYGIQSRFKSCFFRRLDGHLSSCILFHAGNRWLGICLDYFGGVMVFLSTITCLIGSTTGIGYILTPMTVGMAIKYTLAIPAYLNWLVRFLTETETGLNSVERICQYTRLTPESQGESLYTELCCPEKNCKCRKSLNGGIIPGLLPIQESSFTNVTLKPIEFSLQFQKVSLYYDKRGNPILSDVSFKLKGGEKVGVCGRTGSGKSSLLMGLMRMVDRQDGFILIRDSDIRCMPLDTLRKYVSIVPQEIHMFSGSIRFNLNPENNLKDEELWRALELVQMKKFVSLLPNKLDTQIAGNHFLSAGQTQLLVLTRVLLEKRPLVLLDEVAAEQDPQMEKYLLRIIQQELPDSTVIMVAHSVSLLLQCDRVLSIDQGRLVEDGTPTELSRHPQGLFATLLRSANNQQK